MSAMKEFTLFMLEAIANFVASEPVFYLFGVIIFCFICKAVKTLIL